MIYVTNQMEIKQIILDDFHQIPYVAHPDYQKLLFALREEYFWLGMRIDISQYLSRRLDSQ